MNLLGVLLYAHVNVTIAAPAAAVGVTYDNTKTYYQQATPGAAAAAVASTGQVAATVPSSAEFQNWQQAGYNARQTSTIICRIIVVEGCFLWERF